MNKVDSMSALFSGLTGSAKSNKNMENENVERSDVSSFSKSKQDNVPEERFCTIADRDALRKIRIIAAREHLQIKEVVNAAFALAISNYEKKHGKLDSEVKGNPKNLFE